VTDVTKAGVPNTAVSLKVPGIDEKLAEVRSNQDGHFSFPSVPAREYEIRFQASGFYTLTLPAKRAAEGGDYDVGIVALTVVFVGDTVDISPPPSTPASPIHTTLCELVKDGDHFHGEFVELRAEVYPGGPGAPPRLLDSSCGANVGLLFPDEQSMASGKDLPLLKRYVEQHRVAMATVSGKFALVPVYSSNLTYTLNLETASDIVVTPTAVPGSRTGRP